MGYNAALFSILAITFNLSFVNVYCPYIRPNTIVLLYKLVMYKQKHVYLTKICCYANHVDEVVCLYTVEKNPNVLSYMFAD